MCMYITITESLNSTAHVRTQIIKFSFTFLSMLCPFKNRCKSLNMEQIILSGSYSLAKFQRLAVTVKNGMKNKQKIFLARAVFTHTISLHRLFSMQVNNNKKHNRQTNQTKPNQTHYQQQKTQQTKQNPKHHQQQKTKQNPNSLHY